VILLVIESVVLLGCQLAKALVRSLEMMQEKWWAVLWVL
jgi:hypothetical protein